jgi:hypothetical protein
MKTMKTLLVGTALAVLASILATTGCSGGDSASSGESTESVEQDVTCPDGAPLCGPRDCAMHMICGEPIYCGGCPSGEECSAGTCCRPLRRCPAHACGTFDDGCGGQFCCGTADYCCN